VRKRKRMTKGKKWEETREMKEEEQRKNEKKVKRNWYRRKRK
jgi:hypothetical protein